MHAAPSPAHSYEAASAVAVQVAVYAYSLMTDACLGARCWNFNPLLN